MYLVVYATRSMGQNSDRLKLTDHYEAFETLAAAETCYDALVTHANTYSASICSVLRSTDYGVTP